MRAEVRLWALCVLSPEHRSSLTALGIRPGSARNSCPWMSQESGRDKEEGTIIQLLQPQVPGREQGGGGDQLLNTRPFGLLGWEAVKGLLSYGMVSNGSGDPLPVQAHLSQVCLPTAYLKILICQQIKLGHLVITFTTSLSLRTSEAHPRRLYSPPHTNIFIDQSN